MLALGVLSCGLRWFVKFFSLTSCDWLPMLTLSLAVAAAAENEPHYHNGKLTRYEIGPPSVLLSRSDEERLSSGKPVMQAMETGIVGARRLLMVQDIAAPPNVVMECACARATAGLAHRPRERSPERPRPPCCAQPHHGLGALRQDGGRGDAECGVQPRAGASHARAAGRTPPLPLPPLLRLLLALARAASCSLQEGGLQRIKTTYDIAVLHMKMRYFMEHEYDPEKRCMTFHLDYSRRSDIDDSVGYWRATQPRCSRDAAEMCSREIAEGLCRIPTRETLPRHSREMACGGRAGVVSRRVATASSRPAVLISAMARLWLGCTSAVSRGAGTSSRGRGGRARVSATRASARRRPREVARS